MKDKYIICGPGRTKSHMIFTYLIRHGYYGMHIDQCNQFMNYVPEMKDAFLHKDRIVIHYHGRTFMPPDPENYTVILNNRRDIFSSYCSRQISKKIGQWTEYKNYDKNLMIRLKIDDEMLLECKHLYGHFIGIQRLMLDHRPWKKIVKIDYEDIGDNYDNLFNLLPINRYNYIAELEERSQKSPYTLERHIYNFENTRKLFNDRFKKRYGIKL